MEAKKHLKEVIHLEGKDVVVVVVVVDVVILYKTFVLSVPLLWAQAPSYSAHQAILGKRHRGG